MGDKYLIKLKKFQKFNIFQFGKGVMLNIINLKVSPKNNMLPILSNILSYFPPVKYDFLLINSFLARKCELTPTFILYILL